MSLDSLIEIRSVIAFHSISNKGEIICSWSIMDKSNQRGYSPWWFEALPVPQFEHHATKLINRDLPVSCASILLVLKPRVCQSFELLSSAYGSVKRRDLSSCPEPSLGSACSLLQVCAGGRHGARIIYELRRMKTLCRRTRQTYRSHGAMSSVCYRDSCDIICSHDENIVEHHGGA